MRAILVDDEYLSLAQLKKMLERDVGGIEVIGTYTDPAPVPAIAKESQPDVLFLDIHMPEVDGLALGEQVRAIVPDAEIVFVTAYDRYALKAFELPAMDYILKPFQLDRLKKTVDRLKRRKGLQAESGLSSARPWIRCFNQIRFQLPGQQPQTVKWRTSKAQELFAYLLNCRDQTVGSDAIIELLWPDFEPSGAMKQLYTTVYHIRQTLKVYRLETVSISSGDLKAGYKLSVGEARIDTTEWEAMVKRLDAIDSSNYGEYERVLDMYEGSYLGDYEYLWAENERERLRSLWLFHAQRLSRFYIDRRMPLAAVKVNQRIQQLFPLYEESYFTLMKLYASLDEGALVEEQYSLLASKMAQELDSTVSDPVKRWYEHWKRSV
ncbi:response regulator [Paenibacillus sp. GYB003]|uniref:response regulator n=1 Tax=Paenibacillus sp. GYB003 TaxID=2994392 RepID=UPI002F96D592